MFFALLFACEQVVDIEIPEQDSQLVLSSFYESGDLRIKANLTRSLHILSPENAGDIWDASIRFYENEVLIGQLEDQLDTLYASYQIGIDSLGNPIYDTYLIDIQRAYFLDLAAPLQTGKTYKLLAEAPDFKPAFATQELLPAPNVVSFDYKPRAGVSLDGGSVDLFKLGIQDLAGEDNYYEIALYLDDAYDDIDTTRFWQQRYLEGSFTPGVEEGQGGSLLTRDDLFNGNLYNIDLTTWPIDTTNRDIRLVVKSISRDKYLFSKSINAYWNAEGNPFAEPVIVPTNVENGLGIFSIENSTEFIVE